MADSALPTSAGAKGGLGLGQAARTQGADRGAQTTARRGDVGDGRWPETTSSFVGRRRR